MRHLPLLLAALTACSSSNATPDAHTAIDAARVDAPAIDAATPDAAIDAPPADIVVTLAGGANALLWDAASSTLFLTNNDTDKLIQYTDGGGLADVAVLPAESAGISLGGIVKLGDGSKLIANFGFGTQGTLFAVTAGATPTTTALTGLDSARRRIALAVDSNGTIYSSYFTKSGSTFAGGVSSVAIAGTVGTETEVAGSSTTAGFQKVVGLVATPTALFVSDQTAKTVFQVAVPGFAVTALAAGLPAADLLYQMPNGDLLTGGGTAITRITTSGTVTTLPNTGFEQVRGVAFDPVGHRLFVIDHSATAGVPDKLHIQPLAN